MLKRKAQKQGRDEKDYPSNVFELLNILKEVRKTYMNTDNSVQQNMHGNTKYWIHIIIRHDMKVVILVEVNLIRNSKFKQVRKPYMNAYNSCKRN